MKKTIFTLLIGAFLIINLAACEMGAINTATTEPTVQTEEKEEVKTISLVSGEGYKSESSKETNATIIEAFYPFIQTNYDDENIYPELKNALTAKNEEAVELQQEFFDIHREFAEEINQREEALFLYSNHRVAVRRADTKVTSLLNSVSTYEGGVHGYYYFYGENYDTKTGKELKLLDVVKNREALNDAIKEQLEVFWGDVPLFSSTIVDEVLSEPEKLFWTLDYNGLSFYFEPYSLASYASGAQFVTVSNVEYPEVLKEEYKEVPASYGVELADHVPFYSDVTGDGVVDQIIFSSYQFEEDDVCDVIFMINGQQFDVDIWAYNVKATFVHTKEGKNYVLFEGEHDSDLESISCYDLSQGIKPVGEVFCGRRKRYHNEEDALSLRDVLTNPEGFYLQKRTQHLSSVTGYREYHVGQSGLPEPSDIMFSFDENEMLTFTLMQDIMAELYDEETDEVVKNKKLKSGDAFLYYGTDDERYAYLKSAKGKVYRVEAVITEGGYEYAIDDIEVKKIFNGLFYAG